MEDTTLKTVAIVVPIVMLILQGVLAWISWSMNKKFMTTELCTQCREKIEVRVNKAEKSIVCMDGRLDKLPSEKELQGLSVKLSDLGGKIDTLSVRIDGQESLLERVERPLNLLMEHHLNHRDKS